jgi:hypothetical protein
MLFCLKPEMPQAREQLLRRKGESLVSVKNILIATLSFVLQLNRKALNK